MSKSNTKGKTTFSRYEVFIITILTILQFTVILDFMVLSPLGAMLMPALKLTASEFSLVVSAYALSAGISGILAAGFADKYDKKRLLLFFYTGFIIGTALCALSPGYSFLMIARIVTGIFGGVLNSIIFAIITDLFKAEFRGRVMGFVQMAFAASQVLGLPIGLQLANKYGWHSPFWMIVGFSLIIGVLILIYMQPLTDHLKVQTDKKPFHHLYATATSPQYLRGFIATIFIATGGFMLMPFGTAYTTNNLGLSNHDLPTIYWVTGIFSIIAGPLIGKAADKAGKYVIFLVGSLITMVMVLIYTQLGLSPLYTVVIINVIMFIGITARMISVSALITTVPQPQDRGAFMSINSSVQQVSGAIASGLAGLIVIKTPSGYMENYSILGYVVTVSMILALILVYRLNNQLKKKALQTAQAPEAVN